MSFLGRRAKSSRISHGTVQWLSSSTSRTARRRIGSASSPSVLDPPAKRRWISYTAVFSAAFGGVVAYRLYKRPGSTDGLNPVTFTPFTLISKEPVSSTCSIFTLRSSHDAEPREPNGARVWSVQIKQPQLQIARAYTPLPPSQVRSAEQSQPTGEIRILIRKEPKGEVSGYLHDLSDGATVDIRGPNIEYVLPDDVEEVVFLAGGTGIAPALQVAHSLLCLPSGERSDLGPRIHILWACRRREDCIGGRSTHQNQQQSPRKAYWGSLLGKDSGKATEPLPTAQSVKGRMVQELEAFQARHPDRISVDYFIDEEKTYVSPSDFQKLIVPRSARASSELHKTASASQGRKLILVSGPDGFVAHFAGPWEYQEST